MCSGIEAVTVAWRPLELGFDPIHFAEVDPFCSALLEHHYPEVPNLGDITQIKEWPEFNDRTRPAILVGGTPCQSFSVAGLRAGMDDLRGQLTLSYLAIAKRYRPRWVVWENVPGVLSADDGRALGSFLRGLALLGYGFAYRVLDAQYFGLAQRRKRIFVVGYLGDWRRAAAVLFERESLCWHPAPSRKQGEGAAERLKDGPGDNRWPALVAPTINAHFGGKQGLENQHALGGAGLFVPDYINTLTAHNGQRNEVSDILNGSVVNIPAITIRTANTKANGQGINEELAYTLDTSQGQAIMTKASVRRLMPIECERLQGFPDDYTNIPYPGGGDNDGNRYKALGNSMAVPVLAWIGRRLALVDGL